jgi:hypothetical protein
MRFRSGPQMPLNDIAIRTAKPGPKPVKLSDERGLSATTALRHCFHSQLPWSYRKRLLVAVQG